MVCVEHLAFVASAGSVTPRRLRSARSRLPAMESADRRSSMPAVVAVVVVETTETYDASMTRRRGRSVHVENVFEEGPALLSRLYPVAHIGADLSSVSLEEAPPEDR